MTDTPTTDPGPRPFTETGFRQADDRPRIGPPLLTPEQSRQLAQASIDAGQDPAVVRDALARDGIEWVPDTRTPAERSHDADFERGHPERYSVPSDHRFADESTQDQDALAHTTREFVAQLGFDRSGGSDLAGEITKAIADQHGLRPDARSLYEQRQGEMLGSHRDRLVKDAAAALENVHPDLVTFMRRSGALSSANVVMALAHMAQARAARG